MKLTSGVQPSTSQLEENKHKERIQHNATGSFIFGELWAGIKMVKVLREMWTSSHSAWSSVNSQQRFVKATLTVHKREFETKHKNVGI